MKSATTWPKLKRDYTGCKVITVRPLRNGLMLVPKGTVCTVTRYYRGLHLRTDPCSHCGIGVYINQVDVDSVELISVPRQDDPND